MDCSEIYSIVHSYFCTFPSQVKDIKNESAKDVLDTVSLAVLQLTAGALSVSNIAELFKTISTNMNDGYSEKDKKEVERYSVLYVSRSISLSTLPYLTLPPLFLSEAVGDHVPSFM